MYGGPNYFNRENNYPFQYNQFYNQPFNQQEFQQQISPHINTSNQTPFEQLKKPSQPYQWSQSVGQNQMNDQQSHVLNWQGQMEQYPYFHPQQQQIQQQIQQWPQEMQQHPNFYQQQQYMNRPPSIMSQFQNENGQIDVNKMLHTVGQLANTVQQVSPVVKQIGDLLKTFI